MLRYLQQPRTMRRVNGALTLFWVAMVPVSYALGWLQSVAFVSALSLWALVSGHWSAWQAARVEVQVDEDANVADAVERLERIEWMLEQQVDELEDATDEQREQA